jgi:hypothetical protein
VQVKPTGPGEEDDERQRSAMLTGNRWHGIRESRELTRITRSCKSRAVRTLANLSGLSAATIRRDLRLGYLTFDLDGLSASDGEIERWLVERRVRCGGLTLVGNHWLWSPWDR